MKKDIEHARMMFSMAYKDLKAMNGMKDEEIFDDEIFGFHAQQSVEKMLKSWLSLLGEAYPKIHDLEELIALLKDKGEKVPKQFYTLVDLADFAVQFRYESFDDLGTEEFDRAEIIQKVNELATHVRNLIKELE